MRIGIQINYAGGFRESVAEIVELERAGLDIVFIPEAYSFDAVSQLGFIAARTERVEIASGIVQIYTRTPTLTAMTAAGLDFVSDGRFTLGMGASGPQVIEGFHGVKYDAPLARTREVVEICRQVWRRERVVHDGRHYQIPLPADQGTGLGKPLKLINHPVRSRIPIMLASLGPKNVALTAEIAEAWEPIFFHPEKAKDVWGAPLAEGKAKRDSELGELDTVVGLPVAIGDDVTHLLDNIRHYVALYVGGMGARGKNFYNDLMCRYGYEAEAKQVQDLYLDGKKDEAAAALPRELLEAMSLVGPVGHVKERLAAFREAGATTLQVNVIEPDPARRPAVVRELKELTA
ncbi:LLM class F420-dependent oxidoreductase [Amycolatopsis sp. CA-230715]|uniref:LLM class F420-dependent oxidoreductase n=1 Tax=Amycolatopsis sp. CA-230715 TaxID=2745196 RepID=UPI001C00E61B|nr:LLM class F420-dependent oxidoreductase [Amycolatopsis sp. CA-230715]QWF76973.1 Putative coenzyme F420-dependent oxidoreductase [Amycolatopsis sp. CA-230715]